MPGEQITSNEQAIAQRAIVRELGRAVMSVEYEWMKDTAEAIRQDSTIFTIRGVGATGRMEQEAFDQLMSSLIPLVAEERAERPVVIMYDGDTDNPSAIDVGHVVGALADTFGSKRRGRPRKGQHPVRFMAAQVRTWYGPLAPEANLASFNEHP